MQQPAHLYSTKLREVRPQSIRLGLPGDAQNDQLPLGLIAISLLIRTFLKA